MEIHIEKNHKGTHVHDSKPCVTQTQTQSLIFKHFAAQARDSDSHLCQYVEYFIFICQYILSYLQNEY